MSDSADLPTTAADDAATLRLDTDALKALAAAASAQVSTNLERTGDFIGRYRLITKLGEGGFGVVWRAEQSEPIHREVALKVIKPGMDSREIIARFEAERQALALMDHPNIAGVLDAGTTDNGRPFFVMELVKGVPITDYCDAHQLTIRQRLELFIPVCQAVQHAHQKAILHRDLKPSNILVTEVDGKPVPKVIDFGIAKALHATSEPALHATLAQTMAGMVIGTPQYMSPEQAGSVPDVDTRSDIYTLGVILYELLVGDTPLSREQMKKAALDEVLRLVREGEPKRPSSRFVPATDLAKTTAAMRHTEPKKLGHVLRGDLDWIVLKALEKDRARRYDTANAFAQDLRSYLQDEPVSAAAPTWIYQLSKFARRNRLALSSAIIVTLALVSATVISLWQAAIAKRSSAEAEAQRVQVTKERDRQNELLWVASRSDHEAALRAFGEQHHADGLAYLDRALAYRPMNSTALVTSAAHAFGMNAPVWRTRWLSAGVSCVAFSPNGRHVVAGSRVIETATGKEISKLKFSGGSVDTASFSPDGQYFVAGCTDKTARVFEAVTGREISKTEFGGRVTSVSFSSDGRCFVAGSGDKTAKVIEAMTGKEISRMKSGDSVFGGSVLSVSFSPDGQYFVAGSVDSTARVIEAATGKEISKVSFGSPSFVHSVCFSPDGRYFAVGNENRTALVIEAMTGKEISKTECGGIVYSVSFSPDGRYYAAGGADGTAHVIEAVTGKVVSKAEFKSRMWPVAFSPDGRYFAAGGHVIEAVTGKEVSKTEFAGFASSVCFSPDGRYLAACGVNLRMIEAVTGCEISSLEFGNSVQSVSFSSDGRYLVAASLDGTARVIEPATGKEVSKVKFQNRLWGVNFSPDGRYYAAGSYDKTARVIEAATGKEISKTEFGGSVRMVSFSPDGRYFAAGCTEDKTVRVIEAATGKEISKTEFGGSVGMVSFSPDGRYFASGCTEDKTVRVIEAVTGKEISKTEFGKDMKPNSFTPDGRPIPAGGPTSLSFSPDERYFVAGSQEKTARVIEAMSGKEISKAKFGSDVLWVSFNSDDRYFAADRYTARMIEAATGKEMSKVEFGFSASSVSFSPDGRYFVAGASTNDFPGSKGETRVIEAATDKEIFRMESSDGVKSLSFSPDGRHLAVGNVDGRVKVVDCSWFNVNEEMSPAWRSALSLQLGYRFQPDGKPAPLSPANMTTALREVAAFVSAEPKPNERWQHAILKWSQMPPEQRTTSPWTQELFCISIGRRLIQSPNWVIESRHPLVATRHSMTIADCADQAPWHPLEPVSMARLEPKPDDKTDAAAREVLLIRPRFLARLTLKRMHDADEKLYGRDTLAEYAAWSAKIMHEELHLDPEALKAITFALERTQAEKQQALLDLKAKIESTP